MKHIILKINGCTRGYSTIGDDDDVPSGWMQITDEEVEQELFNITVSQQDKEQVESELRDIEQWYLNTDYIPNKILTGEWELDDPRWVNYKAERLVKRNRRDYLKTILKNFNE